MNSERTDRERELRSKVCEIHNLRYDPQTQTGCALCRRESVGGRPPGARATTNSRRGGPPLVVWILIVAVALVLAALIFGPDEGGGPAVASNGPSSEQPSSTRPAAHDEPARQESSEGNRGEPVQTTGPRGSDNSWPTHEAVGEITIEDAPEDEPFRVDDKAAPDLRSVRFRASGGALSITFEFTGSLRDHAFDFATGIVPAVVFVDTDLDASTGERGFAGRPGFERAISSYLGVRYDPADDDYFWSGGIADTPIVGFACSHDVGTVSGAFLDSTFDPSDDEALDNTSCRGNTLELRVPYRLLDVRAGQTVRLATEENMGSGKRPQYFLDDVLLTLE